MLFYPIPQSLGCASYVASITLARKFINNGTFLVGRNAVLLNGWKGSPSAVKNTRMVRNLYDFLYSGQLLIGYLKKQVVI